MPETIAIGRAEQQLGPPPTRESLNSTHTGNEERTTSVERGHPVFERDKLDVWLTEHVFQPLSQAYNAYLTAADKEPDTQERLKLRKVEAEVGEALLAQLLNSFQKGERLGALSSRDLCRIPSSETEAHPTNGLRTLVEWGSTESAEVTEMPETIAIGRAEQQLGPPPTRESLNSTHTGNEERTTSVEKGASSV